ncbi:STAS domain-containing protein [Amycolatopsis albispora]|uniref:STAS domain-containing protein n=1 Tax=Amycolatopsis albispora TaxID=1804986 RepID=A0A344L0I6_9PSEU|nr:STAS domain-containing protein [Amycolatopsis albispora]AXB41560.1 hypothetical protein A4R43_02685 [Amycolatopsis albispora]
MNPPLSIDVAVYSAGLDDTLKVLTVSGEIDETAAAALQRAVDAAWRDPVPRLVLLDLAGVRSLCPRGARVLLAGEVRAKDHCGTQVVCRPSAHVRRMLASTSVADLLWCCDSVETALAGDPASIAVPRARN